MSAPQVIIQQATDRLYAPVRYSGSGSPEGVVTSDPGWLYRDTDSEELWIKASGTGNTGWVEASFIGGERRVWAQASYTTGSPTVASRLSSDSALYVRYALLIPASGNADTITFGPDSNASLLSAPVGLQQEIKPPDGNTFRLYDWYAKAPTTANQSISILYLPE